MTRAASARLAGIMLLAYIATGIAVIALFSPVDGAQGVAAKLLAIAGQVPRIRVGIVFSMLMLVNALVLAVALYAITRDHDPDLAVLALTFRVAEGVLGSIGLVAKLGLLWLATSAHIRDAAPVDALAALLFKVQGWSPNIGAFAFAIGSTIYAWLFLRSRSIPGWLARFGILASVLLVAGLPAQLAGFLGGTVAGVMWLPMLVFELALALWLLIKGVHPR